MSNRQWALIGQNYVCQKDDKVIFTIEHDDLIILFPLFDKMKNNEKFLSLYGLKQNLQDKKSGNSTPETMTDRLKNILSDNSCKIRISFDKSSNSKSITAALANATVKKGSELTQVEVEEIQNMYARLFG